ncbi:MAG: polyamine aminopropyltransferase [Myxococcales bacterium]|nr:polyamine aminopropyltransferase [Myxococcales bacterium]
MDDQREPHNVPSAVDPTPTDVKGVHAPLLLLSVLVIATCGLVYELVAGTLASYLLGDSVTQFSTIIGVYLSSMGLGSYLSKFIQRGVAQRFVDVELAVALIGGLSAPILFLTFGYTSEFRLILYGTVVVTGTLVGLEIPLLLRILRNEYAFKDLVAQVLTFDYIGALFASILFPLWMMPKLGIVRTSIAFGILNAAVAYATTHLLRGQLGVIWPLRARALLVLGILGTSFIYSDQFTRWMEDEFYTGAVVYAENTPYQRIVVTRDHNHFQLYLNGNLQFNSADEYRYHEALVHPAFAVSPQIKRVLVCGGGDGLATREILKYQGVERVVVVDLDPAMTRLGAEMPLFLELNDHAYADPRVHIYNEDAMIWLAETPLEQEPPFDVVIVDFPDPNNFALGKLYTTHFYHLLSRRLAPHGVFVVQSTSPLFARQSYWCVVHTIEAAGLNTLPYHIPVPSFGDWGYVMASKKQLTIPTKTLAGLRYLNDSMLADCFDFPNDMDRIDAEVNRLNNQILVQYYESEWRRWN